MRCCTGRASPAALATCPRLAPYDTPDIGYDDKAARQVCRGYSSRSSAKGDITLATLQRYAAALGCELSHALIPKRSLLATVEERADRIARDQVSRVRHSMALEDQLTSGSHSESEIEELRRKLLDGKRSRLWQ